MIKIEIPVCELVDVVRLNVDGKNPNFMSKARLAALEESIVRFGFLVPVITNKDYVVADGEQRLSLARKLRMQKVPVVRLPVSEVDRKLIRQVMNKLRGEHIESRDAEEFEYILKNSEDGRKDLTSLLLLRDSQIDSLLKRKDEGMGSEDRKKKTVRVEEAAAKCPQCGYIFNPAQHKAVDFLEKVEFEGVSFQEIPCDGLNKDYNAVVNVVFETKQPDITERVIAVAHSFGLGIDETHVFPVFKNFVLRFSKGDLVYVTGDSGSGKTVLLVKLLGYCKEKGLSVACLSDVVVKPRERVIESLGADIGEAMSLLSKVGLSEAFIMLAEYQHLSEGQRYRYRLAKLFAQRTDVVIVDEFCATLDREMARVISYNFQRFLRRTGQTAFVASTHRDIVGDLDPDILVVKTFGSTVQVRYMDSARQPKAFSLTQHMKIESSTGKEIAELLRFHYLSGEATCAAQVYKLTLNGELAGAIVYNTVSSLDSAARAKFFPEYADTRNVEGARRLNEEVRRISRVIINPKYRGVGLAEKLVRETLILSGAKLVETVAAMAKHNPFFERAGMCKLAILNVNKDQDLLKLKVKEYGGNPDLVYSIREAKRFWGQLTAVQKQELTDLVLKVVGRRFSSGTEYGKTRMLQVLRAASTEGAAAMLKIVMLTEKVYLAWQRPDSK